MLKVIDMAPLPSLQRTQLQRGSASALSSLLYSSFSAGYLALLFQSFGLIQLGKFTSACSAAPRSLQSLRYNQAFKRTASKPFCVLQRQLAGRRLIPRWTAQRS